MYDLVQWLRNPNFASEHLEGLNINPITGVSGKVIQHCFDTGATRNSLYGSLVFSKTDTGNPMDAKSYNQSYITDLLTERSSAVVDWQNPKNYKQNGWTMLPRFWDGDISWYLYHASAPFKTFTNCVEDGSGDVGPTTYTLYGPYLQDYGGMLGILPTIVASYFWSNRNEREQIFMTDPANKGKGWVKWTHGTLQSNGLYLLDSVSLHNQVIPGTVKPNFPCFPL